MLHVEPKPDSNRRAGGFDTLVEICSRFPGEFFWVDIFCKNQWVVNSADTALELQRCVKAACNPITHKPHVLFLVDPWPEPIALGRIWCLFELMHALLCNAVIRMETSREARDSIVGQSREEQLAAFDSAVSLDNARATVASDIDLIMAAIRQMPGGKEGMEQKLKTYLHEGLGVYLHPDSWKRRKLEPVAGAPDLIAKQEVEGQRSEIEAHLVWGRALLARMASVGGMSESEQDEGEHRASLLQTMDADMETDADTAVPLMEALELYGELGLLEAEGSSDSEGFASEDSESSGGANGGGVGTGPSFNFGGGGGGRFAGGGGGGGGGMDVNYGGGGEGGGSGGQWASQVEHLVQMGFEKGPATAVLEAVSGNLEEAIGLLTS